MIIHYIIVKHFISFLNELKKFNLNYVNIMSANYFQGTCVRQSSHIYLVYTFHWTSPQTDWLHEKVL